MQLKFNMGRKPIQKKRNQNLKRKTKYVKMLIPVFQEHGLKSLTMDDIAAKLNVSKATLYNYFATKEEIVSSILQHVLGNISTFETIIADPEIDFVDRYFDSVKILSDNITDISNIFLADIKTEFPHLWQLVEQFKTYARSILENFYAEGQKVGVFNSFSTNILVLSDQLFFDGLSDPEILESHNLTIKDAFHEYFKMKCLGMLNLDHPQVDIERVMEVSKL